MESLGLFGDGGGGDREVGFTLWCCTLCGLFVDWWFCTISADSRLGNYTFLALG